jgi:hypothetical protein
MATDLLEPAGPRCGCWPHDSMVRSPAAPMMMMMSASPGRGSGDGAARPTGSIDQTMANSQALTFVAHFGLSGAMLLDPLGPALRLLTHVADFHFSDIAVRGDDGARTIGANDDAAARYGATGSTAPTPLIENGVDWTTRVTLISHPTRAREVLMMAGAGGAMRATGWRATAIPFQQFGEREGTLGFRSFARNSMHLLRSFGPRRVCLPQRACKFSRKNCMKACSGAAIRRPLG